MTAVPVTDPQVLGHLARARLHALSDSPYMAAALTAMLFLQVEGMGTVGVDDRLRVYLDPEAVMSWSVEELAGALLHEANHFLRSHHARAPHGPWHAERWNVAGDLEINDDLLAAGIVLPAGALTPERMGTEPNRTAEWYFGNLPHEDPEVHVCCGSGATGVPMPWELGADGSGVSTARARAIMDQVAEAVRSSPPGSVPGGLSRWAEARAGEVPWEKVLRAAVRGAVARGNGQTDYSWSTPNRRHRGPVILPRLRGTTTTVLCVIDTSGSMSQAQVDTALGEVVSVARSMCVERTYVASCDTEATFHGEARSVTTLELTGGGGTSLESALGLIETHRLDPDVVVFLTDGFAPWSDHVPAELARRHTIVVTPAGHPTGPDWAQSVVVKSPAA